MLQNYLLASNRPLLEVIHRLLRPYQSLEVAVELGVARDFT